VRPAAKFCAKCGRALGAPAPSGAAVMRAQPAPPAGIACPHCGKPNRIGAKFCAHCRQPLGVSLQATAPPRAEVRCPRCNTPNRADARFCKRCRCDLAAPAGIQRERKGAAEERARVPAWVPRVLVGFGAVAALVICVTVALWWWLGRKDTTVALATATPTPTASAATATPAPTATETPRRDVSPAAATPVTPSIPAVTPTAAAWQTFEGTGYTLLYPTGWYVYQSPPGAVDRTGARYDLILSDAPGNRSPQSATPDESARVTVYYLPKAKQPLEEWVSERWAWLDVPLTAATLDDAPALGAAALSTDATLFQEFVWIEHRGQYYTVKAYARADALDALDKIKKVMDSFLLKK
jgi:hypothetical protein